MVRLLFITPFHATAGDRASSFVFVNPESTSLKIDVTGNKKMEELA